MANIEIVEVKTLSNYQLYVKHADGTEGFISMKDEILSPKAGSMLVELRDPEVFAQVKIDEFGGLQWPNEFDACYHWTYFRITGKDPHEVERS